MRIIDQLKQPGRGKEIKGQDIMDFQRFAEDTRHMLIFDVLSWDCPVGDKGERIRIFLTDTGYKQALDSEGRGEMKIVRHARVSNGYLFFDTPKRGHEIT